LENLFVGFMFKFQSMLKSVAQLMLRKDKMMKGVRIGPMKQNQGIRIGLKQKREPFPRLSSEIIGTGRRGARETSSQPFSPDYIGTLLGEGT
jgi:hypothetical protein